MSDIGTATASPKSAEVLLTKQLARKLHLEHSKRASGGAAPWKDSSMQERKLWLVLAKLSVFLLKKNGYAKA